MIRRQQADRAKWDLKLRDAHHWLDCLITNSVYRINYHWLYQLVQSDYIQTYSRSVMKDNAVATFPFTFVSFLKGSLAPSKKNAVLTLETLSLNFKYSFSWKFDESSTILRTFVDYLQEHMQCTFPRISWFSYLIKILQVSHFSRVKKVKHECTNQVEDLVREQDKLKYLYLASVRRTITITMRVTAVANGITRKKEIGWMMNNTFFRFLSSFIKKDDKCNVIECNNFNRVVKFQQVGVYTWREIVTHHEKSSIHFNFKITEVRPWNAIAW